MISMDPTPKRRWSKLGKLAAGCTLVLAIYCGSFFGLRKVMSVTFIVGEQPHFYSVLVFYFSKNRQLNYAAWLFYYPLHRQSSDSLRRLENALLVQDGDEEMARQRLRYFHIADVDVLYRAEVIGFH
jgi:hypothetical protein